MDETGFALPDRGVLLNGQTKCASLLTVKHQSDHNKRYTCQFVNKKTVMIEGHYTPVFIGKIITKSKVK